MSNQHDLIDYSSDTFGSGNSQAVNTQSLHQTNFDRPTVSEVRINQPNNQNDIISSILESWELPNLYPILQENNIKIETLKCMEREDVHDLLRQESLGTRIKFNSSLKQWQRMQGINTETLDGFKSPISSAVAVTSSSNLLAITSEKLYLKDVLRESGVPGLSLLRISENRALLSDENRYTLVDLIVTYFINKNLKFGVNECQALADDLQECFQGEVSSVYFKRRPNMKPKGQLYDRYNNRISKLRSASLIPKAKRFKSSTGIQENSLNDMMSEDGLCLCMELKFNRDDSQLDEILSKWTRSAEYRCNWIKTNTDKNIGSIIQEWPAYEQAYGPTLIGIDFNFIYPDACNIYLLFERFCRNVLPIMEHKIVEQNSKQMLKEFKAQQHISADAHFSIILLLLHALIKPTTKSLDIAAKKLRKHTTKDSQNSFIVLCQSSQDVDVILQKKKVESLSKKKPIQPCIFVVGKNFYNNNKFYVICDNIKYKCVSILSAVDCTFKLFHVFNLKYPEECKAPWHFIQKYLYKIETPYDDCFPAVDLLISKLNKHE